MSYDKNNIFAKIIKGDIPCSKIYEDDSVLAFKDINPVADIHVIVVPRGEYISFNDFCLKAGSEIVASFFKRVQKIAEELNIVDSGYRLIMNHGSDASQSVDHFHVHIIGGKALGGLIPGDIYTR